MSESERIRVKHGLWQRTRCWMRGEPVGEPAGAFGRFSHALSRAQAHPLGELGRGLGRLVHVAAQETVVRWLLGRPTPGDAYDDLGTGKVMLAIVFFRLGPVSRRLFQRALGAPNRAFIRMIAQLGPGLTPEMVDQFLALPDEHGTGRDIDWYERATDLGMNRELDVAARERIVERAVELQRRSPDTARYAAAVIGMKNRFPERGYEKLLSLLPEAGERRGAQRGAHDLARCAAISLLVAELPGASAEVLGELMARAPDTNTLRNKLALHPNASAEMLRLLARGELSDDEAWQRIIEHESAGRDPATLTALIENAPETYALRAFEQLTLRSRPRVARQLCGVRPAFVVRLLEEERGVRVSDLGEVGVRRLLAAESRDVRSRTIVLIAGLERAGRASEPGVEEHRGDLREARTRSV